MEINDLASVTLRPRAWIPTSLRALALVSFPPTQCRKGSEPAIGSIVNSMSFKPSETFPHELGCSFSVAKSYPTLCDPMDYSIPGSSVLLSPGVCSDTCH